MTNQKFGRLTAIKPTSGRDRDGNVVWLCECECGNFVEKRGSSLSQGNTRSCGCLFSEKAAIRTSALSKKNRMFNIKGTNAQVLTQKLAKNNTSGYKGVSWLKARKKWAADITFQRKRYWLGSYCYIEDAIQARKIAEEKLHGGFLDWFQETYPERYAKMTKVKECSTTS